MARKLGFTDEAVQDLVAIRHWLTQAGSGPRARRRLAAIRVEIRRLIDHPCRYPIGQYPGVRELPCDGGYRALYQVTHDTGRDATAGDVLVLRVFGPGQDRGVL